MDSIQQKDYKSLCESLDSCYYHLLFITGELNEKRLFWNQILDKANEVCVSRELVTVIFELPRAQKAKFIKDFFNKLSDGETTLFLSNIEILFDPSININPIELFKSAARNRTFIVNWPGIINFSANALTYAEVGHSEYFSEKITQDILFFDISGRNSLNHVANRS